MKKSFLTITILLFTLSAFAQFTSQGTFLLGGSSNLGLNFLSSKSKLGDGDFQDGPKTTSFNISPQVGYFIIDNLAIGGTLDFSSEKETFDDLKYTSSNVLVGPFVRYYFDKLYAEGSIGVGSAKTDFGSGENKSSLSAWSIGAGYALLLNDAVALEPRIGYASTSGKNKETDITSKNSGLFINLSLFVYLSK